MDELLTMDYKVSYLTLILVFIFTFVLFFIILKKTTSIFKRIFIMLFFISYFAYSGVGISILNDHGQYLFFYSIYTIFLCFSLYMSRNVIIKIPINDRSIHRIMTRYQYLFILGYLIITFSILVFPENKLHYLISPPKVDTSFMMNTMQGEEISTWLSITTVLTNILWPFYYLALMSYKKRPIILLALLTLPIYISYCYSAYVARTTMVLTFIFYISILYYYNIKYRRVILIVSSCLMFFSISFLAAYTSIRMGIETSNISLGGAADVLFRIECTFPTWFQTIYHYSLSNDTQITKYILWFSTQPIPGFLKSWMVDFNMNVSIAQVLLGQPKETTTFFVPLTGLVSESVFVFGRFFFIFHALLLGLIMNIFINFLESKRSFKVLMIYSIIYIGLAIGRTGTSGAMVYPFMIKTLVYVPVVMFLLNSKVRK